MSKQISVFWLRRDLRLHDNAGLYHALKESNHPVLPLFIFDQNILEELNDPADARVNFIHQALQSLKEELRDMGSDLLVKHGRPKEVWKDVLRDYEVEAVYTNRDYEPYAIERDEAISQLLESKGGSLKTYKDHVIFEKEEVVKQDGDPYTVFTPYKRKWLEKLHSIPEEGHVSFYFKAYPTQDYFSNFYQVKLDQLPTLDSIGFEPADCEFPDSQVSSSLIKKYDKTRDYPALDGTSRLGVHFRFGTISIRDKAAKAHDLNQTFLRELVWRDFYSQILANFPHVVQQSFRSKYDRIEWRNNEEEFELWCQGKTGYPMVDAGMRELNSTGYMHNRVRMVVASFLTKHLLIDWRWGEAYFAEKLLDYELSSNNGGWQWAAGSGTDAAPYFRIFNPESQQKKFDPDHEYIKKWIDEWGTNDYPKPIVDHKEARARCLATYKKALS